ncbi:MAG: hypothetical protein IPJ23_15155 [Ignavibacteriales bacterium]|nr:hypothetical protein [Ignavibacteriales bacterium]
MLKHFTFLFVFILSIGSSYAQYVEFTDITKLLELAKNRAEVEEFLKMKGFEFYNLDYLLEEDDDEDDTTHYQIDFVKHLEDDEYYIRVIGDYDEEIYSAGEYSSNPARWDYFVLTLAEADMEPKDTWDNGRGQEGFEFEAGDYNITLRKDRDDDGSLRYKFFMISLVDY